MIDDPVIKAVAALVTAIVIAAVVLILFPDNHARCKVGEKFVLGEDAWYCVEAHQPN